MGCTLYGGVPIEQVDFEKEFDKELAILEENIAHLKARRNSNNKRLKNYEYWTIKLNRANRALEVGQVVLD